MPLGEGRYVPAERIPPGSPGWPSATYPDEQLTEQFSMPFWTELRDGFSVTWLLELPFDTRLAFTDAAGRPALALRHRFDGEMPYVVRVEIGPPDPIAGALAYRDWRIGNGTFPSLTDKLAAQPEVVRLGGAPHIYLWGSGLLKAADVLRMAALRPRVPGPPRDPDHLAGRLWAEFDARGPCRLRGRLRRGRRQ